MQATRQAQSQPIPTRIVAILFALAALAAGSALGYTLKPVQVVPGPTHVVVASGQTGVQEGCVRLDSGKGC